MTWGRVSATRSKTTAGFTLIEIMLAMAIFALGGVSILAMFLANSAAARRAADENRAVEISASVRAALEGSLQSPITISGGAQPRVIFPFSFPFGSMENLSSRSTGITVTADRLDAETPTYFFELPKLYWQGADSPPDAMLVLPRDLLDRSGSKIGGNAGTTRRVWYYKPTRITAGGEGKAGRSADLDDRDVYAFNFLIRRSVERSDIASSDGSPNQPLSLYVVQLRIFKGYEDGDTNEPMYEQSFTLTGLD